VNGRIVVTASSGAAGGIVETRFEFGDGVFAHRAAERARIAPERVRLEADGRAGAVRVVNFGGKNGCTLAYAPRVGVRLDSKEQQ
jgi:hypothetical protein